MNGMTSMPSEKSYREAFGGYEAYLRSLIARYRDASILELGGGRKPTLALGSLPDTVAEYTVNDISERELSMAPDGYGRACFDVCGENVAIHANRYDVVFSRMLAEHVPSGEKLHRNVLLLLKSGGTAFHFFPTLYASPFILNSLLPNTMTERLLNALFKNAMRQRGKFPAYYSGCRGRTGEMADRLRRIGYVNVDIRRFYGHRYYERVPLVRELENAVSSLAARRDWSVYGSFAYVTCVKPA